MAAFPQFSVDSLLFDCERLIDNGNEFCIKRFNAFHDAEGLTYYLKKQALKDEKENSVRNYVVKLHGTEITIAYFTLKAGAIPYTETVDNLTFSKNTKLVPGIELVNIALNDIMLPKIKTLPFKVGEYIFYNIVEKLVLHVASEIGVKVLYLFAMNKKLAEYYKTWGFRMIEDDSYNDKLNEEWQSDYSQNCIFMYKPIAEIV